MPHSLPSSPHGALRSCVCVESSTLGSAAAPSALATSSGVGPLRLLEMGLAVLQWLEQA